MNHPEPNDPSASELPSRRSVLRRTTAAAALTLGWSMRSAGAAQELPGTSEAGGDRRADPEAPAGADPQPRDPFRGTLDALGRHPLVAVGEIHLLQELHDFLTALLFHPDLPGKVNDVVVEFGNAQYQELADRFVLRGEPVANAELSHVWRHTLGGGVLWDAPVYAQFFRTVRAVNWMQPPDKRIRVLLGDPAFDHHKVRGAGDLAYLRETFARRDPHFAEVVEREVLEKGRRALLVAGTGHLLRGVKNDRTGKPNAASLLDQKHPGKLFVICPLLLPPRAREGATPPREQAFLRWPRPSLAALAGTWLGSQRGPAAHRALKPDAARFSDQADATLYLGPQETLTASRSEPALYQGGDYAEDLKRQSEIEKKLGLRGLDGLAMSLAGPRFFDRERPARPGGPESK